MAAQPSAERPTPRRQRGRLWLATGALLLAIATAAWAAQRDTSMRELIVNWAQGVRADHDVVVTAADGTALATSVLRPWWRVGALPTVLIRTPYGRRGTGRGFARRGYAVVVQDMRGRHDSGGVFQAYTHDTDDAAATLDWIVRQPWSNGRVATFGCSALGESQLALARRRHPAHRAMIAEGAGGGVGSAGGRFSYFGVYESGVFQLASAFGWFVQNGEKTPTDEKVDKAIIGPAVRTLPVLGLVDRHRRAATDFDLVRTLPLGDARWDAMGYLSDADRFTTPGLHVNGWYDQGVSETLLAADLMRRHALNDAAKVQPVIIGPGLHCIDPGPAQGRVGDLSYRHADEAFVDTYAKWLAAWLDGDAAGLRELPAYQVFVLNEDRWLRSSTWPPEGTNVQRWHLASGGRANSRDGDGTLAPAAPGGPARSDLFVADPMNPVPTRGGAFCCTGDARAREGPVDQSDIESRADVLVYTSAALATPLRIVGPLALNVEVATSARDTDLVAKLVDVAPDGRALNIQSGVLRLRYRNGLLAPELARPGERYRVRVHMRDIAYLVPAGHRLRLQIAGSDFPRLERNLQTGGRNYDETAAVVAENRVFHGAGIESYVELPVLGRAP